MNRHIEKIQEERRVDVCLLVLLVSDSHHLLGLGVGGTGGTKHRKTGPRADESAGW